MKFKFLSLLILLCWLRFHTAQGQDVNGWFVFDPSNESGISETSMDNWFDKPAGKHGFVKMNGDKLIFEDGTPVKFWGTNIAGNMPFMKAEDATKWASFLSRYGFNMQVRECNLWHTSINSNKRPFRYNAGSGMARGTNNMSRMRLYGFSFI